MSIQLSKINKTFLASSIYAIWIIVFAIYNYQDHKTEHLNTLDTRLELAARNFVNVIPKNLHHKNIAKNSITKSKDLEFVKQFNVYAKTNNIHYIYSMILKNNKIFFVASNATEEDIAKNNGGFYFYPYDDAAPYVYESFKNKEASFHNVNDQWGSFRSVFVPLQAKDGTVYVVGADIPTEYISNLWFYELIKTLVLSLFFILTAIPFFMVYKSKIHHNHNLDIQVKVAKEANKAKSKFLLSMSHELRTPLNAVLGFSQLIELSTKDEMIIEHNQQIMDAGNYLLELINEILDLSKIESGNENLSIKNHCLNIILNYALTMIKPLADKYSIQIDDKVSSFPEINVNVDEIRFMQVLLNILSNAIKYNKEKGNVTIDSSFTNNMLCLSISDTGVGLTPEQLDNLFTPFERFGAKNSHIEGTGIGLVITKDLVELMGGRLIVESEVGNGSRFIIQVPLAQSGQSTKLSLSVPYTSTTQLI